MRNFKILLTCGFVVLTGLLFAPTSQAVPAFARQMDAPCSACHFQHFPLLNAFGRAFKASGFTMTTRRLIEGERVSFPADLNAALFTNIRYQSSNGTKPLPSANPARDSNNGEWLMPAETSLFVSGRISPNMGALLEGDVGGAGTQAGSAFLASLKLPFMYDTGKGVSVGVVPFTAGLGPAYALELLNTGAVGNHVITLVHPKAVSAQQYIQGGPSVFNNYGGDAEGMGLVAVSGGYFVTLAKWSPNHLPISAAGTSATLTSDYARVAVMPQFKAWDLGFGIQYFGGRSSIADTGLLTPVRTKAYAMDAQAQGTLGNMPLGVYLSYATAPGTSTGEVPNLYNQNPNSEKATSIALELGAFQGGAGTVQLAYRKADNGAATNSKDNALTAGFTYLPWSNVQLSLLQTWYRGGAHSSTSYNLVDASGSGTRLTSLNLAIGF